MASIRFIRNVNLKVTFEDTETMVPFAAGNIYTAIKIEVDAENYNNIYMPDGSIINGVAGEVFENMSRVPVVRVPTVETVKENVEIKVEEEPVEPTLLDGIMLSKSEESDEYGDPTGEPFATTYE